MLPCVLPHMLVQSLFEHKMWPTQLMPELVGATKEYWDHMSAHTTWGLQHPGRHSHEPVALYGDDAAVNKNGEKLFCVTLSHVLDPRKNSMCTLWPLCVFKCVTRLYLLDVYFHSWEGYAVCVWVVAFPVGLPEGLSLGYATIQAVMGPASWLLYG